MKTFIFDMDGTIFDTEKIYFETWKEIAKKHNFYFDIETKYSLSGKKNEEAVDFMVENFAMEKEKAMEVRKELNDLRDQKLNNLDHSVKKEGLVELLDYLKESGHKIGLASSSSRYRIDFLLEREGLLDYFDLILSADDVENGKPSPDIFIKAMGLLDANIEDTYIFEDSYPGIVAAKKSGAKTVLVIDLDDREEIKEKADLVYTSLAEVLEGLRKKDQKREVLPQTFEVTCPKCQSHFDENLYTLVFEDSKMREEILDGDFAKIHCPTCQNDFELNYRYVYTDKERKFMLVNDPSFEDLSNQLAFRTSLRLLDKLRKDEIKDFTIRMCKNTDQVREKILIFEQDRDDRIVELMKFFTCQSPDFPYKNEEILEFSYVGDDKFKIRSIEGEFEMDFVESLYQDLKEKYKENLEASIADMVDGSRALAFVKKNL